MSVDSFDSDTDSRLVTYEDAVTSIENASSLDDLRQRIDLLGGIPRPMPEFSLAEGDDYSQGADVIGGLLDALMNLQAIGEPSDSHEVNDLMIQLTQIAGLREKARFLYSA